jgi:glutamine amidotransferase
MQLLFDHSDEGDAAGLGLLAGRVVRFPSDLAGPDGRRLKVPHMGWNALDVRRPHPTVEALAADPYVYFVHSYHAVPADGACVVATADYGGPVPAVVARANVVGVQFHPEKSGPTGLGLLRAWDAATAALPAR